LGYIYDVEDIISTKESGFRSIEKKEGFCKVKEYFAKHPDCKTLIITELSRLSRYDYILLYIREYLKENHIQLFVKDINFKLFDDDGICNSNAELVFSIHASIAASEMQQKRDRFNRAKVALREDGFVVGGRPLFGYKIQEVEAKRKSLVIDPFQAEQIKKIFQMYVSGLSIPKIRREAVAQNLDPYFHALTNVQKCLRESAYIGTKTTKNKRKNYQYFELGKETAEPYITSSYTYSYPQIIDRELFDKVQQMLSAKNTSDKASKHISILSKLLRPVECGCCLVAERKQYPTYACKRECKFNHACNKKRYSISMNLVDGVIWEYLKENIEYLEQEQVNNLNEENLSALDMEIGNLNAKIADREKDMGRESTIFRAESLIDEKAALARYEKNILKIKQDIDGYKSAIRSRESKKNEIKEFLENRIDENIAEIISHIANNPAEKQKYIRRFIDKIRIHLSDYRYTVMEVYCKRAMGHDVFSETEGLYIDAEYILIDKKSKRVLIVDNDIKFENKGFLLAGNHWDLATVFTRQPLTILDDKFADVPTNLRRKIENTIIDFHLKELPYPLEQFASSI